MSDHYKPRQSVIQLVFLLAGVALILRAFQLQVWDSSFREQSNASAIGEYIRYPARGVIYDRDSQLLVYNNPMYDLMVTYNEIDPKMDTAKFCKILDLTKEEFSQNLDKKWNSPRYDKKVPFVFLSKISAKTFAEFQESLYEFPGFFAQLRGVRGYPHKNAAHVLGYIREVNRREVDDSTKNYKPGDYIGATGLEKQYEEELRGEKGLRVVLKDNLGREVSSYNNGNLDRPPVSGQDIYMTIDLDLQKYGESLMVNKIGSIVAIEPSTGKVLTMISTPTYDPNKLTITQERASAFVELQNDSLKPFLDRSIMAQYPPGSLFKTIVALIGLEEAALFPTQTIGCQRGYAINGQVLTACHGHPTCTSVSMAIQHSCNAYFVTTFRNIIDKYDDPREGLEKFDEYLKKFGLGHPLGIDFPGEKPGNFPDAAYYDKVYAEESAWKSIWIRSLGIGQGELLVTNLQLANVAAIIANRGYYFTPHLLNEIHAHDGSVIRPVDTLSKKEVGIAERHFSFVVDGMEKVVTSGTARLAYVDGLAICGKTGTAENNQGNGEDHSIFFAFAPKDDPQIAIAVYVENGSWGGSFAAPIASLIIEKYLTKNIGKSRKWLETRMLEANLLPKSP